MKVVREVNMFTCQRSTKKGLAVCHDPLVVHQGLFLLKFFNLELLQVSNCAESGRSWFHHDYRLYEGNRFVLVAKEGTYKLNLSVFSAHYAKIE